MASLSSRTPEQESRREEVEASVLDATLALLAEGSSFADLRIEQIAGRAGLSRTAFYFYFRDKREVLTRLTQDVADLHFQQADRWFSSGDEGETGLADALVGVCALWREHGLLLRAVVEAAAYDDEFAELWEGIISRFIEAARMRIEADQAAGRSPAMPAAETAAALVWMTERSCYQRIIAGDDPAAESAVQALVGICERAVYGRL